MDAILCPHSCLMHLAGALYIPAVALFSTIPAHLRTTRFRSTLALQLPQACAPGFAVEDSTCPLGHPSSIAWNCDTTSPASVIEAVESLVRRKLGLVAT